MLDDWIKRKGSQAGKYLGVEVEYRKGNEVKAESKETMKNENLSEPTISTKKAGLFSKIDRGLTGLGEKFKDYRAKRPEREKMRMEKMKERTKQMKVKFAMQKEQMGMRMQKMQMAKSMGIENPFGSGGGSTGFGMTDPFKKNMPSKVATKKRSKKKVDYKALYLKSKGK